MTHCEWGTTQHPCFARPVARVYTTGNGYLCCEQHWRDARRWRTQHMGADSTHVRRLSNAAIAVQELTSD
jgi:hypothetical protein